MHLVHLVRRFASRSVGLSLGFALISMLVSGCFQAAGAALEPTATGNVVPTVPATQTQIVPTQPPTQEQPTVQPTTEPPTQPAVQPTEPPTAPPAETVVVVAPGSPTVEPTQAPPPTELPTETPVPPTNTPQAISQAETPVRPFAGGPQASQTAALATIFAQATQILVEATQTAAVDQTATATAQGTFVPGPTGGEAAGGATPATLAPGPLTSVTGTPQGTPGAPGSGAAGAVTGDCVYTVAEGDRIFRIALRFGLTPNELSRANGIVNADLIVPGQRLRIPNCNGTPTPVRTTPTLGVSGTPGTVTPAAGTTSGQVYVVQEGDTLFGIATRFRVRVMALAQANGITNINLIYIGQRLVIP